MLLFAAVVARSSLGFPVRSKSRTLNAWGGGSVFGPRSGRPSELAVRNVDLPEALVFYGAETFLMPQVEVDAGGKTAGDDARPMLRPGVARLLHECRDVGTQMLVLSEELGVEEGMQATFREAWGRLPEDAAGGKVSVDTLMSGDDAVVHFRCLDSELTMPAREGHRDDAGDASEECEDSYEFYDLQVNGRSPSPAFLLDALCSVQVDPRGFGGSSGFGRGQWIEPVSLHDAQIFFCLGYVCAHKIIVALQSQRRSPMPARAVVFVAGDRSHGGAGGAASAARNRCAAARVAGCRTVWLETPQGALLDDDASAVDLCDAVVEGLGSDDPRDLHPVTLDAVSTPGDYWLNPPLPRDDVGNRVSVDDIVEFFRAEREMEERAGDEGCVISDYGVQEEEMSEHEMDKILADMDGL